MQRSLTGTHTTHKLRLQVTREGRIFLPGFRASGLFELKPQPPAKAFSASPAPHQPL